MLAGFVQSKHEQKLKLDLMAVQLSPIQASGVTLVLSSCMYHHPVRDSVR
jgi:hypothetical protein